MPRARAIELGDFSSSEVRPTPERRRQARQEGGDVRRAEVTRRNPSSDTPQFMDARGEPGAPFKVIDTLDAMLRAGTIRLEHHDAGCRFRDEYEHASGPGLKAMRLIRLASDPHGPQLGLLASQVAAAASVAHVLRALGEGTLQARCAVEVIAQGASVRTWRGRERIRGQRAGEIVAETLRQIAAVYAGGRILPAMRATCAPRGNPAQRTSPAASS